jgi:AraC-like DNA-binding protein
MLAALTQLSETDVFRAHSWHELENYLDHERVRLVLVDPAADGAVKVGPVISIINRCRAIPVVAYCRIRNELCRPLLELTKAGLADVVVYPLRDNGKQLIRIADRLTGYSLAYGFLGLIEPQFVRLEPRVQLAMLDLFKRPYRYQTGADIARESHVPARTLYRTLHEAGLATPKKYVTVAKILHGYSYLRDSCVSVETVSNNVGYSGRRKFSDHVHEIFGCSPLELRAASNIEELIASLFEWLCRPVSTPSTLRC